NRPRKWLNSKAIAGAKCGTLLAIPDDKRKHAIEAIDHFMPPMDISFNEHFSIRVRLKLNPFSSQFLSQFLEIVNFPIKYNDKPAITAVHRLLSGRQIDNC